MTRHGHNRRGHRSATYMIWSQMVDRCRNQRHPRFDDYGGRGITVCARWLNFENFLADMGERPLGLSLDRKKNDQGYCKRNCRWATRSQQARNRRTSHILRIDGAARCLADWCDHFGIDARTVHARMRRGMPATEAVAIPARVYNRHPKK